MSSRDKARMWIDQFAIHLYEEPFASLWADRRSLPETLRTVALVIDYDTEVAINGLTGLLENSIGEYLPEIIDALVAVGAERTASTLRESLQILEAVGSSPRDLRERLNTLDEWTVTTFKRTHGQAVGDALADVRMAHSIAQETEQPCEMLEAYVAKHETELRSRVAFDDTAG